MTEDEAVQRCQHGDRDAFRYLVERHQNVVFGTAYNMTGNPRAGRGAGAGSVLVGVEGDTWVQARESVQAVADAHPGQHGDGASPQAVGRDHSHRGIRVGRRRGTPRGLGRVSVGAANDTAGHQRVEPGAPAGGGVALLRRYDRAGGGSGIRRERGHREVAAAPGASGVAAAVGRCAVAEVSDER